MCRNLSYPLPFLEGSDYHHLLERCDVFGKAEPPKRVRPQSPEAVWTVAETEVEAPIDTSGDEGAYRPLEIHHLGISAKAAIPFYLFFTFFTMPKAGGFRREIIRNGARTARLRARCSRRSWRTLAAHSAVDRIRHCEYLLTHRAHLR